MGGSSGQVVGYKYYTGLMVVIGNTIEELVSINPDNRGWILEAPVSDNSVFINKPNLFGGDKAEGGWVGWIDVHTGKPEALRQNPYLAQHDSELVSAYPNLSYLVFRGVTNDKGFQLVSMSGMMKEVLYCVKRIHIKNDGSRQWNYDKAEISTPVSSDNDEPNLRFTGSAIVTSGILDGSGYKVCIINIRFRLIHRSVISQDFTNFMNWIYVASWVSFFFKWIWPIKISPRDTD